MVLPVKVRIILSLSNAAEAKVPEHDGTLALKHTQIIIHWTENKQESFRLGEVTRIGRGKSGNDIPVPEVFQSVSRRHLEIRREADGYRLIDLGSRNGALLNGVYVKDTYLRDGDEIRFGQDDQGHDIRIEFRLGSEALLAALKTDEHVTIPPTVGFAGESPVNTPHFRIRWHTGRTNYFPVLKDRIIIGRAPDADLRVPETLRFISGRHVEVLNRDGGFLVRDLNSTNGTLLNNQLLEPGQFYPLVHEAIVRFGDDEYGISIGLTFLNPRADTQAMDGFLQAAPATEVARIKHVLIGRLPDSDLVLDHPEVSRRHALIRRIEDKYFIEDLNSSNGTLINDHPIKHAELCNGDVVQVSNFVLLFRDGRLIPYQSSGMRLDVSALSKENKTRNGVRRILEDIHLSVLPREFVALIGGSTAGASDLLNALVGVDRGQGQIKLNGHDFYHEYDSFRSQMGYVPRAETLHEGLTVEKALDYAARLRLPVSLSADERRNRIEAALDTVSLNTPARRRTRIEALSAEQRKRLSIAAELLGNPKLIYLDDATAGLDPGVEKKLMHMLRRMADEGRTVILTAQATGNIVQTDHIACLSDGRLVFFGPAEDALDFFEVEELADIYEAVDGKGEHWRKVFEEKKPEHYKKYVEDRQASLAAAPKPKLPRNDFGIVDYLHQFAVLIQRLLSLIVSDPIWLSLVLLLLPLIGLLQLLIAEPDILTGNLIILADPAAAAKRMSASYAPLLATNTFLFLMALAASFSGLFLSWKELLQERSILQRERMINLKLTTYLGSKILIYGVFAAIQVLLYLTIVSFGVRMPAQGLYFNGFIELFLTLFLTMMAGIALGLLISAASRSMQIAISLAALVLFFQLLFAGALFDLRGSAVEPLSYLSSTRWSTTALGVTIDMNKIVSSTVLCDQLPGNACQPYPGAGIDLPLNYDDEQLTLSWSVLIAMTAMFLAGTWLILQREGYRKRV